ncbi:Sensor protein CreC [bacterium HR23]|nr:Sensor protein CreC [bacterium HR23]
MVIGWLRRTLPSSLAGQLALGTALLLLVGVGSLVAWTGLRLQRAIVEQAEHHLETQAFLLSSALSGHVERITQAQAREEVSALVALYAQGLKARVVLLDRSLQPLARSDEHEEEEHRERERPKGPQPATQELVSALAGTEQHAIRPDPETGKPYLFVASPVLSRGEVRAVLQLGMPMAPVYAEIRRTWTALLASGGVVLLAGLALSVAMARYIARPLAQITRTANAMAQGDLSRRARPAGPKETRQLAQAFNQMADQVQETLARQEAFAVGSAHELRTPLTAIRLRLEMLQEHGLRDPSLTARYIPEVLREVEHLQRLVDHLLELARLRRGQTPPRVPQDLAPLLYEEAEHMAPLMERAGIVFQVEVPPHLPSVVANADEMRVVVRNLLDNALKNTPPGGTVTLEARPQNGWVAIAVRDTGKGIAPQHLPHVFEPFYRAEDERGRRGAGLGLALVKEITTSMGGQVSLDSTPGHGTTVTLRLPATGGWQHSPA